MAMSPTFIKSVGRSYTDCQNNWLIKNSRLYNADDRSEDCSRRSSSEMKNFK